MNFKTVKYTFFAKNPDKKDGVSKSEEIIKDNIYENNIKGKELYKKFNLIHFVFKYKFFIPLLWLSKKILKKAIVKEIPNKPYNKNITIFNNAFDTTLIKWLLYYRRNGDHPPKPPEEWLNKIHKENEQGIQALLTMKELIITMAIYDTAYREFFNILMHEIAEQMHEEYSNKKKYPEGVGHLFYARKDAYDVHYKYLFEIIETRVGVNIIDAMNEVRIIKEKQQTENQSNESNTN